MEDQPRPDFSRDVSAAKKFKGKDNNSVEDKEAREEKCLIVRAPDERRLRLYFELYSWFDDQKGLLHQEEHFSDEGASIFFLFLFFFLHLFGFICLQYKPMVGEGRIHPDRQLWPLRVIPPDDDDFISPDFEEDIDVTYPPYEEEPDICDYL